MRPSGFPIAAAFALALLGPGCSSSDDPAGPGPEEPVPPTIAQFFTSTANPLRHGDTTRLVWKAPNAEVAAISPGIGTVSPAQDGSVTIHPAVTTTYTLTVSNSLGSTSSQFTVEIDYPPGLYVSGAGGDDAGDGATPATALKTLGAAIARAGGGAAIYVTGAEFGSSGTYVVDAVLDGADVSIYGARDPATFFEAPATFTTTIRSASGTPLVVRNTATRLEYAFLRFDAAASGAEAVRVENAGATFRGCTFDASSSTSGTAVLLSGNARVTLDACRVLGGRDLLYPTTAGIRASAEGDLLVTNSFIDGGRATDSSAGIESRGVVRLGFNTILAEVTASGVGRRASAIRIVEGHPAIGGNILMGDGAGQRLCVEETTAGTNPSWLEGNLFISLTTPPYLNADGESPSSVDDLEGLEAHLYTTGDFANVGGNFWSTTVAAQSLFANFAAGDFHLVNPLPGGGANPAVDRGALFLLKTEYGAVTRDVDLERRPSSGADLDLGADER